ncbi:52 kDa repressor of the inhibitor of the protein kinase-like [Anthonomus grandis grandis]|uniref:52 kDa repressor of the inhibitor of the protein kinase-like n=1 Tax=Anthonomus grandis grandis TaxID=2921223 RepID=UPI0021664AA9|nr:52 kDa repressor of the inhibitor of the protein kinase-like [Anthonomus grandis grandis]
MNAKKVNTTNICCYKNCPTTREDFKTEIQIKYFRIPTNKIRCKRWLALAGRDDLLKQSDFTTKPLKSYQICFLHFKDDMFLHSNKDGHQKLCLRLTAEPIFDGSTMLKKLELHNGLNNKKSLLTSSKDLTCSCVMCYNVGSRKIETKRRPTAQAKTLKCIESRFSFKSPSEDEASALIEQLLTIPEETLKSIVTSICLKVKINVMELYEDEDEIRQSLRDNLKALKSEYEMIFKERQKRGILDSCRKEIIEDIMSCILSEVKIEPNNSDCVQIKTELDPSFEEENNEDLSIKVEDTVLAETSTDPLIESIANTSIHIKEEIEEESESVPIFKKPKIEMLCTD